MRLKENFESDSLKEKDNKINKRIFDILELHWACGSCGSSPCEDWCWKNNY